MNHVKAVFILCLLALGLRDASILYWRFDGLYGQDPYAYWQQAAAIAHHAPAGRWSPQDFFWPNGYPLLITLLMIVTGKTALAGQLASLISGVGLVAIVYLMTIDLAGFGCWGGRGLGDRKLATRSLLTAGVFAGLIIAVAGQPILSSIVVMADMPALFWASLAAWLSIRGAAPTHTGRLSPWLYLFWGGVAMGLAIITRWVYILCAPGLAVYLLWQLRHRRSLLGPILAAAAGGLVVIIPQLLVSLNRPQTLAHSWLLGWHPIHFFQREFETIDGHLSYLLPVGLYYAQPLGHPAYIFPLLGLASFWGAWRLGQCRQWGALILLLGWIIPVYLFLGGIPYQNFRFGLTLYVPAVILAGYGLADLLARFCSRPARFAFSALVAASLAGMLVWSYGMLNAFLATQNQSKVIARQVEQALPPQATLVAFGLTLTLQHYTQINTLELYHLDRSGLTGLIHNRTDLYLLVDMHNINTQWRGKKPFQHVQWLKTEATLTPVGRFPPYTLYAVTATADFGDD